MTDNLRTINLHGAMKDKFGPSFDFAVESPAEAIRALCQIPGFRDDLSVGNYRIVVRDNDQSVENLQLTFGAAKSMDLIPVVAGAKRGGIGKIILGIVIVAAAFFTAGLAATATGVIGSGLGITAFGGVTYGSIALFGASVLLGGITQALTPQPGLDDLNREAPDARPGFLFNGAITTIEQGGPVPLIFGRMRVGGIVVSSGLTAERIGPSLRSQGSTLSGKETLLLRVFILGIRNANR